MVTIRHAINLDETEYAILIDAMGRPCEQSKRRLLSKLQSAVSQIQQKAGLCEPKAKNVEQARHLENAGIHVPLPVPSHLRGGL